MGEPDLDLEHVCWPESLRGENRIGPTASVSVYRIVELELMSKEAGLTDPVTTS